MWWFSACFQTSFHQVFTPFPMYCQLVPQQHHSLSFHLLLKKLYFCNLHIPSSQGKITIILFWECSKYEYFVWRWVNQSDPSHRKGKRVELLGVYPQLIIETCLHSSRILRTFSLAISCKIVGHSSSVQKENEETKTERKCQDSK